jgi:hypothetical protein
MYHRASTTERNKEREMKKILALSTALVGLLFLVSPVSGELMTVNSVEDPNQDILLNGTITVHELGNNPPFEPNEWIDSSWVETLYRPCLQNADDPNIPNVEVTIVNKTARTWEWLYYVADPETGLTNNDGKVNSCLAFEINKIGANTPLVYESSTQDSHFEPNETWRFVIQDYTNTNNLVASLFGSVGVGSGSAGDVFSSGSIIPEPCTLSLLGLAGMAMLRRRK